MEMKEKVAINMLRELANGRSGIPEVGLPALPRIIRSPYPDVVVPELTLPGFVLEQAEERGDAPALIDGLTGRTLTYRDLVAAVRRVATGLQARGVAKGDVLALCSPNRPEFVITYFAAAEAGAVITTMNPAATGHDIATQLASAGARWLVTTPELFADKGRQAAISKERPTIIHSPYPDVEVPEVSLPAFVLEHSEERGDAPAVIDGLIGRTLSYRDHILQREDVIAHLLGKLRQTSG